MSDKKRKPRAKPGPAPETARAGDDFPPATASIPAPPKGFPLDTGNLRGVKPRPAEINGMVGAVDELRAFRDYAATFGSTALPYEILLRTFERAAAWSRMRVQLENWDRYCRVREESSWREARRVMADLRPAFALALRFDENVGKRLPSMKRLLGAMSAIAQKGVASRKANRQAITEGKTPVRGKLAKRAQRAAAKAKLAEAVALKKAP